MRELILTPPMKWADPARVNTVVNEEDLVDNGPLIRWLSTHKYSEPYANAVRTFTTATTWTHVRWDKRHLLDYAEAEIARIYGYRNMLVLLHQTACALAVVIHERPRDTARLNTLVTDQRKNVDALNSLLTADPLLYLTAPSFHVVDTYHAIFQKPQHYSDPHRFGECLLPACATVSAHVVINCPSRIALLAQIPAPLGGNWSQEEETALLFRYARRAVKAILPQRPVGSDGDVNVATTSA
jgi:hypothetical protein